MIQTAIFSSRHEDSATLVSAGSNGARIDGIWKPGPTVETEFSGSFQPATPEDFKLTADGFMTEEAFKVYTTQKMTGTKDKKGGDRVKWKGETYRVANVEDWSHAGYYKILIVKLDPGAL